MKKLIDVPEESFKTTYKELKPWSKAPCQALPERFKTTYKELKLGCSRNGETAKTF